MLEIGDLDKPEWTCDLARRRGRALTRRELWAALKAGEVGPLTPVRRAGSRKWLHVYEALGLPEPIVPGGMPTQEQRNAAKRRRAVRVDAVALFALFMLFLATLTAELVGAGLLIATFPYLLVWLGLRSPYSLGFHTLGASGAIYGVVLAYSLIWPERVISLMFPPVSFRAIWLIPIMVGMDLLIGHNVSILGHLGGAAVGWILLRSSGTGPGLPSLEQIRFRWNRYRMRRRLRAVRRDDSGWRRTRPPENLQ